MDNHFDHPLHALRHHVTGAVERGEAEPIVAVTRSEPLTIVLRLDADGVTVLAAALMIAALDARMSGIPDAADAYVDMMRRLRNALADAGVLS